MHWWAGGGSPKGGSGGGGGDLRKFCPATSARAPGRLGPR